MSWQKGGDDQLWSAENLPLEMTVSLTVEDLYPLAMSSEKLTRLRYNIGLLSFLENMAGMNVNQLSTMSFSNMIKQKARLYGSKFADGGGIEVFGFNVLSPRSIINHLHDSRTNMADKLSGGVTNGGVFETAASSIVSLGNSLGRGAEYVANGFFGDDVQNIGTVNKEVQKAITYPLNS